MGKRKPRACEFTRNVRRQRVALYSDNNFFGKKLKKQMKKADLTISDLAFITGICYRTLQNWLDGTNAPGFYDVLYLCDAVPEFDAFDFISIV